MGAVTFIWWAGFAACVFGLVRSRTRRSTGPGSADLESSEAGEGSDLVGDGGRPVPRLPAALGGDAPAGSRRRTFSSFDREILAPVLRADVGPDGVRCPGCVDGSVRRYVHRSERAPGEVEADVWCTACQRHTTLREAGEGLEFEDPLAHLDEARRRELAQDLDEYLGGLDLLWSRGALPQQLHRTGSTS